MKRSTVVSYLDALYEESDRLYDKTPKHNQEICGWDLTPQNTDGFKNHCFYAETEKSSNLKSVSLRHKGKCASKVASRKWVNNRKFGITLTEHPHAKHTGNLSMHAENETRKVNFPQLRSTFYTPNFMMAAKNATFEGFLNKCKLNIREEPHVRVNTVSPVNLIRRKNCYY